MLSGAVSLSSTVSSRLFHLCPTFLCGRGPFGAWRVGLRPHCSPFIKGRGFKSGRIMGSEAGHWGLRQGSTEPSWACTCMGRHELVRQGREAWSGVHLPTDALLLTAQVLLLLSLGLRLKDQLLLRM